MKRIVDWSLSQLSDEQLKIYKEIAEGPRGSVVGPLKVWLNNPKFAASAQELGKYARYESSLPPILSELAIITTGRYWYSHFEWEQHAPLAEKNGIKKKDINKIANAIRPIFKEQKLQVVYDFSAEININKNVSDELYRKTYDLLFAAGKENISRVLSISTLELFSEIESNLTVTENWEMKFLVILFMDMLIQHPK